MKKFTFSLEKILGIRQFQQEQAELELGRALSVREGIAKKMSLLARQHVSAVGQTVGTTDLGILSNAQHYFRFLDMQKEQLLGELAQADITVEQKRLALQKAMQKCSSITKLREKQYERYCHEENIEEEKLTDDIVTSRFRNGM